MIGTTVQCTYCMCTRAVNHKVLKSICLRGSSFFKHVAFFIYNACKVIKLGSLKYQSYNRVLKYRDIYKYIKDI